MLPPERPAITAAKILLHVMAMAQVLSAASSLSAVTVIPTKWQERHVMSAVQMQRHATGAVRTLLPCAASLLSVVMATSMTQPEKNVNLHPA
jgi:hypothetical protein